ncbi:hypothetical protein KBD81_03130, partial [Candidatus Woesebacteria bacterium]|nr:hypothetical protein [Candidatus Woesebacteria bacterium]
MNITLLKLGGSLITDKSIAYHAEHDRIDDISKQIARALKAKPTLNLILGNGAGSYAHQSAKKYGTMQGFTDETGRYGACVVHHDAMRLNQIIMDSLLKHDVPVFSMQPSAMMKHEVPMPNVQFPLLEDLLVKKLIPVVYGDVIIDSEKGSTIYSTDTLVELIAEYFHRQNNTITIIHAGNYAGVRGKDDEIISQITPENASEVLPFITHAETIDVSGGMALK